MSHGALWPAPEGSDRAARTWVGAWDEISAALLKHPLPSLVSRWQGCDMFSCVFWEDHSSGGVEDGVEEAIWGQGDQIGSRCHIVLELGRWHGDENWRDVWRWQCIRSWCQEERVQLKTPWSTKNMSAKCHALPTLMGKLHIPKEEAVASRFWDVYNQERVNI